MAVRSFMAVTLDYSSECGTESNAFFRSTKELYNFFLLNVWPSARVCSTNMASETDLPIQTVQQGRLGEAAHKLIRLHEMLVKSLPMKMIRKTPQ